LLSMLAGGLVGAGLMLMGGVLADRDPPPAPAPVVARSGHELLDEVAERVRREYVEPVTDDMLEQGALQGMVENLDPHSEFLDAAEYEEMRVSTAGSYSGVGIEVAERDGRVVVVTPIEGSPAYAAGVRAGDVLLEVDGRPVAAGTLEETIDRMRGLAGSRVRLAIGRQGEPAPLHLELERSEVHVRTVRAEALPGRYGYVRITHFSDATPRDFERLLGKLQASEHGPLRGLVLDLRGNPGGVLESAVGIADEFLERGLIVRADGRTADARFEMGANPGDVLQGAPLVVLVDRGSASGSEIVAAALRDHGRATLMGERTFGKGSVQTVMPLRDGQALKLTTSRYYTPSGVSIHDRGIDPDVAIPDAVAPADAPLHSEPREDPAVLSALQYLRDRSLGTQVALAGEH
jgi:carboxyl-terminal processing protease